MSGFSSLASLFGLAPQPPAIVSETIAEAPAPTIAPAAELHPLADPLDAACDAFLAAGVGAAGDAVELRACMAAAFTAAAQADLSRVVRVSGKGRQARRLSRRNARLGARVLLGIAERA